MEDSVVYAQHQSFLHFSWGVGNQLHVCGVGNPSQGSGEPNPIVSTIDWGAPSSAHERVTLDLTTSYCTFQLHLRDSSRTPVSAAHDYFQAVQRILLASKPRSPMEWANMAVEEYHLQVDAAVWGLLHTALVEGPRRDHFIGEALAEWFYEHAATVGGSREGVYVDPLMAAEELLAQDSTSDDPAYWEVVARLVAVGRMQEAGELLRAHSAVIAPAAIRRSSAATDAEFRILHDLITLLDSQPRLHSAASAAPYTEPHRFEAVRAAWLHTTLRTNWLEHLQPELSLLQEHDPPTLQGVMMVVEVLQGSTQVLAQVTANWVELLVGALLHVHPTMRLQPALYSFAQEAAEQVGPLPSPELSDLLLELLRLASSMEVQQVVALVASSPLLSPWLATHIFDLLAVCPAGRTLMDPLPHLNCTQAEVYRLEYAMGLMMSSTTWRAAVEYLSWCPSYGERATEALLNRLPIAADDERMVHKMLHVAEAKALPHLATGLCRTRAVDCWLLGSVAAALKWALRARDERCCRVMARPLTERILQQLVPGGNNYLMGGLEGAVDLEDLEGLLAGALDEGEEGGGEEEEEEEEEDVLPAVLGSKGGRVLSGAGMLQRCLSLYQALYRIQQHQGQDSRSQASLPEALRAARAAALELVLCEPPSERLQGTVLAAVAPLMEGPHPLFSHSDMMALQSAHLRCVLLQPGFTPASLDQRALQDIFLAATRCSAKAFCQPVGARGL